MGKEKDHYSVKAYRDGALVASEKIDKDYDVEFTNDIPENSGDKRCKIL